jgi:hypothetical protein
MQACSLAQRGDDTELYIQYGTSQRSAVRCIITLQIAYMSEISSRPLFPLTTDHKSYHIIIFPIWKKKKYVQYNYKQALPRQRKTSASEVFGRDIRFEATARSDLWSCETYISHIKQVIIQHPRLQIHKRKSTVKFTVTHNSSTWSHSR